MDADGSGTVTAAEPVFPGKIDGVDKPLLRTLATVCNKLYDEKLYAEFKPKDGESNNKLDQPYEVIKGGEYKDNGISGYDIFNQDTKHKDTAHDTKDKGSASLAEFGEVIDGITDFHGDFQPAFPPFAALIVQPKDDPKAMRAPITQSHPPSLIDKRMLHPFSSPTQLREGACAVRLCVRTPSSSSPGAGLSRCSTGSTMPRALPLSVGRPPPRTGIVPTEEQSPSTGSGRA